MLDKLSSIFYAPVSYIFDITALSALAIWQGSSTFFAVISNEDWEKITGPHGLVFVLICGLIVIWTKSVKDDIARERRHRESIKTQEEHFKSLIDLNAKTADDLTVLTVAATKAQMTATNAIVSMDHNIVRLTNEISDNGRITQKQLEQIHTDAITAAHALNK